MSGTPSRGDVEVLRDEARKWGYQSDWLRLAEDWLALSSRLERAEAALEWIDHFAISARGATWPRDMLTAHEVLVRIAEKARAALGGAAVEGEGDEAPRPRTPLFDSGTPDLAERADAHFSAGVSVPLPEEAE